MVNNEAGEQWCELVEKAIGRLGVQWFALWLQSVGAGPADSRLAIGERLLASFSRMKYKLELTERSRLRASGRASATREKARE